MTNHCVQVLENRKTPVSSYFASWKRWLPIMNAYEKGAPMYFATVSFPFYVYVVYPDMVLDL